MRRNMMAYGLAAGMFGLAICAQDNVENGMRTKETTGRAVCDLLDLSKPELARIRDAVEAGDYDGALAAYRDRLVDLAGTLDMGEPPGFWLWGATNAKDLLEKGEVGTAQYGEFSTVSRYTLGRPGQVDWNAVPDDGYDVVLRDVATMHWVGRLAEAHQKTENPAYLRAFLGYWDDFSRRWLPVHQELLRNGGQIRWDERPHVQRSIPWASKSKLYFAWRLDNLFSWLPTAIAVSPEQSKSSLDPVQLGNVILHVARFEVPGAIRGLQSVGTPNQFVHCAVGLLKTSLVLQDLRVAPEWTQTAVSRIQWYVDSCGYLADGSDMEQSFNYNPGLIHALDAMIELARRNPPLKGQDSPWLTTFEQARDWRRRFLDAVVMPDGRRPATGCDNTWRHSRERAVAEYAKTKGTLPPLREHISNHLLGDGTLPPPAFTSITFPYGGWVVMRDSWTPDSLYAFMKTSRPGPGHMREGGNGLAIAAYGRYLLVNSGDDSYSDRGVFSRYFHSTVSQTSISVDGFSQVLRASAPTPEYDRPIQARWHTCERFDVAEGMFESAYGGWNFRTGEEADMAVTDVRHVRQVIFLRQLGAWIVTDRVSSDASHRYSQSWCLGPVFQEDDVVMRENGRAAVTTSETGANVALYWFSTEEVMCTSHSGEADGKTALGWRALDWNEETQRYAAAVDLLAEWRGEGSQIVVTLIIPTPDAADRVAECRSLDQAGRTGFRARLSDGATITYVASENGTLKAEGVTVEGEALLVVSDTLGNASGVILDDQNGGDVFEMTGGEHMRQIGEIGIPTGFKWVGEGSDLRPLYE